MRKRLLQILWFIPVFFLIHKVQGQQLDKDIPKEEVIFSTPKDLYFVGEKIWLNINVVSGITPAASQIVYAELLNRNNESVGLTKFQLSEGEVLSYLPIPDELPSDNYLLRVFTRISPNLDLKRGLKQQLISILNPKVPPLVLETRAENGVETENDLIEIVANSEGGLSIDFARIQGEILSASVTVVNPFLESAGPLNSEDIYTSIASRAVLPEIFGHIVEAKISGEVDTQKLYYLSVHGEQSALFTDRPDENGSLYFDIGGVKNWDYMIAQATGNQNLLDFSIVSPAPKTEFNPDFVFPELIITPGDQDFLGNLLEASQVEDYFLQEYESNSSPVITGFVQDVTYELDDYTRFDRVEIVLKEYVPEVTIRTIDKAKEMRVINRVSDLYFEENPLFLIDAMPVFNSDLLARFDPANFKTLEILTRKFYLNEELFSGVLSFSSYENDFGGFPIPTNGIFLEYSGIMPLVSGTGSLFQPTQSDKLSDLRTTLYWSAIDNDSQSRKIKIIHSELQATMVIEVNTRTSTGEIRVIRKILQPD